MYGCCLVLVHAIESDGLIRGLPLRLKEPQNAPPKGTHKTHFWVIATLHTPVESHMFLNKTQLLLELTRFSSYVNHRL